MSRTSLPTFLAAVMLIVLVAGCTPDTNNTATGGTAVVDGGMHSSDHSSQYADGTYDATGNYISPAGAEQVEVTLTLEDGIVSDAEFMGKAKNPASVKWQGAFKEGFKDLVVGKSIDEIALTKVSGSSLAPKGFMDAVAQIRSEASAS